MNVLMHYNYFNNLWQLTPVLSQNWNFDIQCNFSNPWDVRIDIV